LCYVNQHLPDGKVHVSLAIGEASCKSPLFLTLTKSVVVA